MLFTDRSLWAMIHGVVLGGAALMGLAAALFALTVMRAPDGSVAASDKQLRSVARLTVFVAVVLWLAVFVGTYVIFPPYRAAPPEGVVDLSQYPRSLLLSNPDTAWLHAFAMESKEHMPWTASMLATAVAFVCMRCRATLVRDAALRRMTVILLAVCFLLVSFVGVMGIFIDKVAPLR